MKKDKRTSNTVVMANAITLATEIITKIAGNEISDTVNGEHGKQAFRTIIAGKLNARLNKFTEVQ